MKIAELMTTDLKTCQQTDTLDVAVGLMKDFDLTAVPVTDPLGRLVGIVTDRDACVAAYTQRQPLHWLPCAVAMSQHVVTCRADDETAIATREMAKHKIRHIPVVDDAHKPIGMVALDDLALAMAAGRGLSATELAFALSAICEPGRRGLTDG